MRNITLLDEQTQTKLGDDMELEGQELESSDCEQTLPTYTILLDNNHVGRLDLVDGKILCTDTETEDAHFLEVRATKLNFDEIILALYSDDVWDLRLGNWKSL